MFNDVSMIVILEDIYYIIVVVYNVVFMFLDLVCFDGVIIDISDFYIKELFISNVWVKGGLVVVFGEYWMIFDDWFRKRIYNIISCRFNVLF